MPGGITRNSIAAIVLFGFGLAVSGCAQMAAEDINQAPPDDGPAPQARMLTAEQAAAAAGEQPLQNGSVFQDVLPPPDWMSTDWVVSSP